MKRKEILTGSVFVKLLVFVWHSILTSAVFRLICALVELFGRAYADSRLRRVLVGKEPLESNAGGSVIYRAFGFVTDGVTGCFVKLLRSLSEAYASSGFKRIYERFFGASAGYADKYVGFAAFFTMVIFLVPHEMWANPLGLLVAALLFGLYAVRLAMTDDAENRPGTSFSGVWLPMLVFGFCLLVSVFVSYDRGDSVRVLTFFITSFALCLSVYASIRDENGLQTVCGFMYGTLFVMSCVALAQRVLGVQADAALTDMDLNAGMPGRVFSTLANPNNYAEFLVLFLPFAAAFVLNLEKGRLQTRLAIGLLVPFLTLLFTYSRSGWIAFAIAALVFVTLYDKKYLPYVFLLVLIAVPLLPSNIRNRLLTIGNMKDTSSSYRIDIWTGCLKMLKDYWFTGIGLGTGGFAKIYPPYAVGESHVAPHSHMHFMEMLIELGALGFVSYVAMTFTLIRRSFVASSHRVNDKVRHAAIASASSMTGIVMIGCFEYCWFYPRVMFAFFVCAGVGMAAYRLAKNQH